MSGGGRADRPPIPPTPFPPTLGERGSVLTRLALKEDWEMARQCLVEGCGRLVKAGKVVCEGHAKTPFGRVIRDELRGLERELGRLADAGTDEVGRREAVREFRWRVERGEYAALFAGRLREAMGDATTAREPGFTEELGALRATLWRLMEDDQIDAVRLAQAVSWLVGTTVRTAKANAAARVGRKRAGSQLAALLEALDGAEHDASSREPAGPSLPGSDRALGDRIVGRRRCGAGRDKPMNGDTAKVTLLRVLRTERERWEALLVEVGTARLTQPGVVDDCSVKDLLGHLAAYLRYWGAQLRGVATGKTPTPRELFGTADVPEGLGAVTLDEQNAMIRDRYRPLSVPEVLAEWRQAFDLLVEGV